MLMSVTDSLRVMPELPSLALVGRLRAPSGVHVPKPDERPDSGESADKTLPLRLRWDTVLVEQDGRRVGNDAALTTQEVRMAGVVDAEGSVQLAEKVQAGRGWDSQPTYAAEPSP